MTSLAAITAIILGLQAPKLPLADPAALKADFNAAKGAPRVVIILSPS